MTYDVNLTGVINTKEDSTQENTLTLKLESTLTKEVASEIEKTNSKIDTVSEEVNEQVQSLLEAVKGLHDEIEVLKGSVQELKTTLDSLEPGPVNPQDPTPDTPNNEYKVTDYGAIPNDGKSDLDGFTKCFSAAGNNTVIVPSGIFNLPWNPKTTFDYNRLMTCQGDGRISIDNFPQPGNPETGYNVNLINPLYLNGFGRFDMSDVKDDIYMSMNMLHEHRSNMDMYHQNYAGVKTRYNQSANYPKWVPWGQCALRLDKQDGALPSGNVTFNIGKFGIMIYRYSTKKWEIQSNPFCEGGGFFIKSYTGSTKALTRTPNKNGGYVSYTVPIADMKDYLVHFWSQAWVVSNPTDIQYIIGFCDFWLDSNRSGLEDYFVCNIGLDTKTSNSSDTDEFLTGRYLDMRYEKRRNYIHNIMEEYYASAVGSSAVINKMIDDKSYTILY